MKRRKLLFIFLLLQVCELEFVNSKHHHLSGVKSKKTHKLYNNMIETSKYIGKTNLFKLDEDISNQGEAFSGMRHCPSCHLNGNNNNVKTERNNMYNKDTLEKANNLMKKSHRNKEDNNREKHKLTHNKLNQKRSVLMKMKDSMKGYENTGQGQYGPSDPSSYPPNGQGSYGYPSNGYPPPGQAPDQSGYQQPGPGGYGPPPSGDPYGSAQPQPQGNYVPESYPPPGSLPPPAGTDYAKPPDATGPPPDMAVPQQPVSTGLDPYADQYGMEPDGYNPYQNSYNPESDEDDIHNSFKCKFLPFFFDECKDKRKKQPRQYQPAPPMAPVAQQFCNMYGTSDLNLSDFEPSSNDWLLVNQNNSLRLTSNKPVQSNMQTLELKNNRCNKENLSCTLQLGENSTAGLSVRGMGKQKTLVELNSLTKTVSLKQVNDGTTQVLLEVPWPKINPNFLHLVQVNDGGFQGTITVLLDGDQVFTKNDLPTQTTGTMGLYISSGNASFGNLSVTPVSS